MDSKTTGFHDLLFNINLTFVVLFFIAFLLIRISHQEADVKKPKAEFILSITWDYDNKNDVDIWVRDPMENVLYYRNKETGMMHLDRDDLGSLKDVITLLSGQMVENKNNQEIVTIRGFIPGEWIVNLHLYNKRGPETTTVQTRLDKLNPSVQTVHVLETVLTQHWEEVTVVRFIMGQDGTITHAPLLPINLVVSNAPVPSNRIDP